jgi:RNA polymerase sigma-70 factor (ECF subfamily)
VARCASGDEAACAELVNEHQRMVFQLAYHLLGNREEALDVSQDVFLLVFRTLGRFAASPARTWIYRIVVNQAATGSAGGAGATWRSEVSLDDHIALTARWRAPSGSPDRVLAQKELADRLWRALDRLPFDQRTAVVLREIDGLSYEDIAAR